jgi:predicted PurR-regulated permease PerM
VLLAIMLGGTLFGMPGLLVAVPVAAALAVLLRAGLADLRRDLDVTRAGSVRPLTAARRGRL